MMSNGPPPARPDGTVEQTSPSTPRQGLQAKWLRQPGSSHEQWLPAYSQPSLKVFATIECVDFFSHPRYDGGDSAR